MSNIKILDCTLRDGGYVVDTLFGERVIKGMIAKLARSRVDLIECGFLKDHPHDKDSSTFEYPDELIPYLPRQKDLQTSIVAMIDHNRYDLTKLKPYDGRSVDMLRECFFHQDWQAAIEEARKIQALGYQVFVQPVDVLGYTDRELLDLIDEVNLLQPFAFSIVDTFGSMFLEDLTHIFSLIDHNLDPRISIGFHSHNNMQLSFALSQKFIELCGTHRKGIVDSSVYGLGRGAGNTNTELVMHYLNAYHGADYDINELMDLIDSYMNAIRQDHEWGYSIPNLIAGMYSSHVHNITYLQNHHSINAKDLRQIVEQIEPQARKRYDYDALEELYNHFMDRKIDDHAALDTLERAFAGKEILLIAPGKSIDAYRSEIQALSSRENVITVSVNFLPQEFAVDYVFYNNLRRYEHSVDLDQERLADSPQIVTSNLPGNILVGKPLQLNFDTLAKRGWKNYDNSMIFAIRLALRLGAHTIRLAGLDGFNEDSAPNFSSENAELETVEEQEDYRQKNEDIAGMLEEIVRHAPRRLSFVTPSRFSAILEA